MKSRRPIRQTLFYFCFPIMHLAFVLSLLAAAVLSIAVASSAFFRIFRRYRLPLCGWWRTAEDDLEIGPGQARETRGSEITPEKENDGGRATVRRFRWSEIESSTENFSPGTVIGQGGSSTVYLSHLPNSVLAAVKLHRPSERLHRAFRQELDVLLYLRHPHIVHLLGYCDDREDEGALVFEYLLNGCLHKKLHGGEEALPWERRMAVAYQVAQALEYLHEVCDPQVVHCDVKAANVLLDGQMDAKLCDFGSARVGFSAAIAPPRSGRELVVGSLGYVDPHYLRSGMVSKKSDVYSFGVLLLELVTGEEAFDSGRELRLTSAMDLVLRDPEGRAAEAMDARLGGEYDIGEARTVVTVAAMCVGENPSLRPSMGEVVRILGEKAASSIATAAGESSGKKK